MKRSLIILMAAMLLVACGDAESKEYEKQRKEAEKSLEESEKELEEIKETGKLIEDAIKELEDADDAESINDISPDELKEELTVYALGLDDILVDLTIDNEIKATIEVADHKHIDDKTILSEAIYSDAGEFFLRYADWEVLTIEFVDIGQISMHREESEANEYGMKHFPLEKIIGQLE